MNRAFHMIVMRSWIRSPRFHTHLKNPFPNHLWCERLLLIFSMLIFLLIFPSCASIRYITHTEKSGVEQLLIAKAVDEALQGATLNIKGSKIFIDVTSLVSEQEPYFRKSLSHWFLKNGARLTEYKIEADMIASILVKSAGTDGSQFSLGLPSIPIPIVNIATPQISIVSGSIQKGYAEMEVILYSPEEGIKGKLGPLVGRTHFNNYLIIFIPFSDENIYPILGVQEGSAQ